VYGGLMSDTKKSVTSSLKSCTPSKTVEAQSRQQSIVKRPSGDELIRVTEYHIELACIVIPRAQKGDQFKGEVYYPVLEGIQDRASSACKRVIFHLCNSIVGGQFLLLQKLPADNSWNKSMEQVIVAGRKGPIKITSNQQLKQYDVEECEADVPDTATAEDLEALCNEAFADLIISQPDHPVLRDAMGLPDIWGGF
jgi:hypothetical protein